MNYGTDLQHIYYSINNSVNQIFHADLIKFGNQIEYFKARLKHTKINISSNNHSCVS